MGVFHSCFAKSNKVGVMREEEEVYDKVCRTMVTEHVTEKKGGLAFGLSFISEEEPKIPPPKLMTSKKEDFEKWRGKCIASKKIEFFLRCPIFSDKTYLQLLCYRGSGKGSVPET